MHRDAIRRWRIAGAGNRTQVEVCSRGAVFRAKNSFLHVAGEDDTFHFRVRVHLFFVSVNQFDSYTRVKLCDALAFAHERGVAHHDVKSANILIDTLAGGKLLLADFGTALKPGEETVGFTKSYASPGASDVCIKCIIRHCHGS